MSDRIVKDNDRANKDSDAALDIIPSVKNTYIQIGSKQWKFLQYENSVLIQ